MLIGHLSSRLRPQAMVVLLAAIAACAPDPAGEVPPAEAADTGAGPIARVGFFYRGGEDLAHPATGIFGDVADSVRAHQVAVLSLHPAEPTRTHPSSSCPVSVLPSKPSCKRRMAATAGRSGWSRPVTPSTSSSRRTRRAPGLDSSKYRGEAATATLFTWGREHVWTRWGLGPEYGVAAENGRFPLTDTTRSSRASRPSKRTGSPGRTRSPSSSRAMLRASPHC